MSNPSITDLFIKTLKSKLYDEIQTRLKDNKKTKIEVISEIVREKGGTGNSFLVEIHFYYYYLYQDTFIGREVKFVEFVVNPKFSFNKRRDPEEEQISTNQLSQLGNFNLPQVKWEEKNNSSAKKEKEIRVKTFAFLSGLRPKNSSVL